jgi:heat-inducible transcriptional repressor
MQPEFFGHEEAGEVVHLCETPGELAGLVAIGEDRPARPLIAIGRELPRGTLHPFSIIKTGYRVGAMTGSLGIIGPKRMPYPFLISVADYTARMLDEVRLGLVDA